VKREQLIFRICGVMRAVEQTAGLSDLDSSSRSILTFIGEAEAEQKILKVSDVVKGAGFGTPPTVYSRLSELEKAGWIEYAPIRVTGAHGMCFCRGWRDVSMRKCLSRCRNSWKRRRTAQKLRSAPPPSLCLDLRWAAH
jgi:hypothetical protein